MKWKNEMIKNSNHFNRQILSNADLDIINQNISTKIYESLNYLMKTLQIVLYEKFPSQPTETSIEAGEISARGANTRNPVSSNHSAGAPHFGVIV